MSEIDAFTDIPRIRGLLAAKTEEIRRSGVTLRLKQRVPYGTQLYVERENANGLITIYYSRKKGISVVDCSQNGLSRSVVALLRGEDASACTVPEGMAEESLAVWIGTDESGKGDFFGPLVIAGFLISREMEDRVCALGVTDSKKLGPEDIRRIAAALWAKHRDRIEVVAPSVVKYNELYERFGNLNRLLAWGHGRVIQNLIDRRRGEGGEPVDGVVSDKFGDERYIRNSLQSMKALNLIQRHRGESNTAVAAASIVARDRFVGLTARLGEQFGMRFPLGAGGGVVAAARTFVRRYGKERLREVAKVHFKTFRNL
ncbi:MAG: hypothetical protein GF344_07020 [Chitinivibrionales bacterium]|nr:hypothetical protein [Chitinivibrionales bacterium]MBD3356662.1 hypothetical protein [Chitinivibrionales bacterium]